MPRCVRISGSTQGTVSFRFVVLFAQQTATSIEDLDVCELFYPVKQNTVAINTIQLTIPT